MSNNNQALALNVGTANGAALSADSFNVILHAAIEMNRWEEQNYKNETKTIGEAGRAKAKYLKKAASARSSKELCAGIFTAVSGTIMLGTTLGQSKIGKTNRKLNADKTENKETIENLEKQRTEVEEAYPKGSAGNSNDNPSLPTDRSPANTAIRNLPDEKLGASDTITLNDSNNNNERINLNQADPDVLTQLKNRINDKISSCEQKINNITSEQNTKSNQANMVSQTIQTVMQIPQHFTGSAYDSKEGHASRDQALQAAIEEMSGRTGQTHRSQVDAARQKEQQAIRDAQTAIQASTAA